MSIYEYDEEAVKKVWQDEAYSEGHQEGYSEGQDLLNQLYEQLMEANHMEDMKRAFSDKAFRERLLQELKLQSK